MEIIDAILSFILKLWVDLYLLEYRAWGLVCGSSIAAAMLLRSTNYWSYFLWSAGLSFIFVMPLFIVLPKISYYFLGEEIIFPIHYLYWYIGGIIFPPLLYICIVPFVKVGISEKTDIRTVSQKLPGNNKESYDPKDFFNLDKGIFLGLDENEKPIYMKNEEWLKTHCQLLGTTGSGKGVLAGVLLSQAALNNETVIAIDPKSDEFLPIVLKNAALAANVPFVSIDLLGSAPKLNPFAGKNDAEVEELLTSGFGITDKGTDADFYRIEDRSVARKFAKFVANKKLSANKLFTEFYSLYPDLIEKGKKFYSDLEELISSPVFQSEEGINLLDLIESGAVIYVRGSLRNPRILKAQKIFLLSCIQFIESRKKRNARSVVMLLDEFKFSISRASIEALSTIRDKKAHLILAHQSLDDLEDCPGDLNSKAVIGAVSENCALKISYKVRTPSTASWLSMLSGTVLYKDESKTFSSYSNLGGERNAHRTIRQLEKPLVDINQLFMLPNRTAVVFGVGVARFINTAHMPVDSDIDELHEADQEQLVTESPQKSLAGSLINVN